MIPAELWLCLDLYARRPSLLMPDKFDKKTRSKIMSAIRSVDTKAELVFRKALWGRGLRGYRVHYKIPGRPDVAFTKHKLAIFIDGDFWHGYLWKRLGRIPPKEYWQEKIERNIERDKRNDKKLSSLNWEVLRFWEHEVANNLEDCLDQVDKTLHRLHVNSLSKMNSAIRVE